MTMGIGVGVAAPPDAPGRALQAAMIRLLTINVDERIKSLFFMVDFSRDLINVPIWHYILNRSGDLLKFVSTDRRGFPAH
jgi:hypothetical protein